MGKLQHSYGGVVVSNDGTKVLLRRVANDFDGYIWSHAKGRADFLENELDAAKREVREELGIEPAVLSYIGDYESSTSVTSYWLMTPMNENESFEFGHETSEVRWVSQEEAETLLWMSTNDAGRVRDVTVLKHAFYVLNGLW